ncbi:MAG: restriction endonuclease [Saprospiraceae bacterium]
MKHVKKKSGKTEEYKSQKLQKSIENVGLSTEEAKTVVEEVERRQPTSNISARKLHYETFRLIRKRSNASAARYNLRKAVSELGPSGYPFERFFGAILKALGYNVQIGTYQEGHCLSHEIDVLADKKDYRVMVECKFKNRHHHKIDTQTTLYVQARFQDLSQKWLFTEGITDNHRVCIATNTSFTTDAMKYGKCMNMLLISWDYPNTKQNLKHLIEDTGMYPLTCLTSLTKNEKQALLNKELVLVKELQHNIKAFDDLHITNRRLNKINKEINTLCNFQ